MTTSGRVLVDLIKAGQKNSVTWKQIWIAHAETYLGGTRDPSKHDDAQLAEFVEQHRSEYEHEPWFQQAQAGQGLMNPQGGGGGRRPRDGVQAQDGRGPGGKFEQLVEAIKAGQRGDPMFKEAWWNFCETYCEGIRDPARHPIQNLELFLSENRPGMLAALQPAPQQVGLGLSPHGALQQPADACKLRLWNVPTQATVQTLFEHFSLFGSVVHVEIQVDARGWSVGTATVGYATPDVIPGVLARQHEILGTIVALGLAACTPPAFPALTAGIGPRSQQVYPQAYADPYGQGKGRR